MVSCNPLQPWTDAINQPGQNSGEREFSPPDAGEMFDRVLVVDDEAKNYPPPGSRDRRGVGSFPRSRRPRRVTLGWRLCRLAVRPGRMNRSAVDYPSWARHRWQMPQRLGVMEIRIEGRDHHARFDRNHVNARKRHPRPGVDHDTLVEHAVEHIDETRSFCRVLDRHRWLLRAVVALRPPLTGSAADESATTTGNRFTSATPSSRPAAAAVPLLHIGGSTSRRPRSSLSAAPSAFPTSEGSPRTARRALRCRTLARRHAGVRQC